VAVFHGKLGRVAPALIMREGLYVGQLNSVRRNLVEFRHASWWNEDVYSAFRKAGIIFCSCSGPERPAPVAASVRELGAAAPRIDGLRAPGHGQPSDAWLDR